VFDIDYAGLPPGEQECLRFVLNDLGWDGYLGFVEDGMDSLHIGCSPASRISSPACFRKQRRRNSGDYLIRCAATNAPRTQHAHVVNCRMGHFHPPVSRRTTQWWTCTACEGKENQQSHGAAGGEIALERLLQPSWCDAGPCRRWLQRSMMVSRAAKE